MAFVFPKEPTGLACQSPLTVILYDPRTASDNKNSSTEVRWRILPWIFNEVFGLINHVFLKNKRISSCYYRRRIMLIRCFLKNNVECDSHKLMNKFRKYVLLYLSVACKIPEGNKAQQVIRSTARSPKLTGLFFFLFFLLR